MAQPPAERILEKTLCEAATQDATPPPPSKALSRGDAVHAVVQAVVVCERQSGSVNLDEVRFEALSCIFPFAVSVVFVFSVGVDRCCLTLSEGRGNLQE